MDKFKESLLFLPFIFLFTATTFVVKEGNVEVGRWVEEDGSDAVKTVSMASVEKNVKPLPSEASSGKAPDAVAPSDEIESVGNLAEDKEKQADAEAQKWKLAKEKREIFGIRRGLTQKRVDQILSNKGVQLYSKYSETDNSSEAMGAERLDTFYYGNIIDWVHEYRYKTDHFSHIMKVYYNSKKEVSKVTHQSEKR